MTSIRDIKTATAAHYEIDVSDLVGPSKERVFAHPRQVAMFIARRYADKSFPEIGRAFGNRDHTTAMYAERAVAQRMDTELRDDMNSIRDALPILRERNLGGVFRSVRAPKPEFQSSRSAS